MTVLYDSLASSKLCDGVTTKWWAIAASAWRG
jgi:hypothetical protein